MISDKAYRALVIVRYSPGIRARGFGLLMWPDSDYHKATSNGGHGSQAGKKMWLASGSFLSKLAKRGLVRRKSTDVWEWEVTGKGMDSIKEWEEKNKQMLVRKLHPMTHWVMEPLPPTLAEVKEWAKTQEDPLIKSWYNSILAYQRKIKRGVTLSKRAAERFGLHKYCLIQRYKENHGKIS